MRAIIVGATGLVGGEILRSILVDPRFTALVVLARRPLEVAGERVKVHVIDFDAPDSFRPHVVGDVLFSALGTTLKAAGSQAAQYRVDHTYQLAVARAARENGASGLVLISSTGADARARIFYSRMKGELERDAEALGFERLRILRPGLLDGARTEKRTGERLALGLLRPLSKILPPSARPVPVAIVARAAIIAALDPTPGLVRYEAKDLFRVGGSPSAR